MESNATQNLRPELIPGPPEYPFLGPDLPTFQIPQTQPYNIERSYSAELSATDQICPTFPVQCQLRLPCAGEGLSLFDTYSLSSPTAYILETCPSGICASKLVEVPIDPRVLSQYGVHVTSTYSVPGFQSYPNSALPPPASGCNDIAFHGDGIRLPLEGNKRDKVRRRNASHYLSSTVSPETPNSSQLAAKRQRDQQVEIPGSSGTQLALKTVPSRPESESQGETMARRDDKSSESSQIPSEKVPEESKTPQVNGTSSSRIRMYCKFCKSNGEQASVYSSHALKNEKNETVCPILRKYVCPNCSKTGDEAHTVRYCPELGTSSDDVQPNNRNRNHLYRSIRNSVGGWKVLRY